MRLLNLLVLGSFITSLGTGMTAFGLAVLALFSQVSPLIGVSLGVNPVNALVLGVLGAPGFGLLLMLQWALR